MSVSATLRRLGGVAFHRDLLRVHPRSAVDRALREGQVIRVRNGVYAVPDAPRDVIRAARVGGRLGGASAARALGLWAPPEDELTVDVPATASTLRHPDDQRRLLRSTDRVRVLWTNTGSAFGLPSLWDTLRQCFLSLPGPYAVAVLDSALRAYPVDRVELARFRESLPTTLRSLVDLADPLAESGTESVLRVELVLRGYDVSIQVRIPFTDFDRLDLALGDRLAIECDSEAHHGGREQRLRDLRRDAYLAALGFVVLRFDYSQVMFELESVLAAIRTYVDNGIHLAK